MKKTIFFLLFSLFFTFNIFSQESTNIPIFVKNLDENAVLFVQEYYAGQVSDGKIIRPGESLEIGYANKISSRFPTLIIKIFVGKDESKMTLPYSSLSIMGDIEELGNP